MTKIKIDKNKNIIEIEGEEKSIKKFIKEQCENWDKKKDYKPERDKVSKWLVSIIIALFLFALVILCPWNFIIDFTLIGWFVLSLATGLLGLLVRNFIFISSGFKEKSGKDIELAYFSYSIFILFSSLLIFVIFNENISEPKSILFYHLLPSINFFVGLMTYSIISFFEKILSIKIGS
ncbi:hypothetical protein A2641_03290 [Candidatus Nomurabacteria bacterium RIFCSPHIGHO2_01_FULL_37_25]|uniref:Uncharacterized protein n=1 Tax=Candidatus Nomurabacteria bacterium RIFCSPLOWO2_01_FULL_36_16 TaxID=1801767 RepID=A0A1F6WZS5_9BACT|nr:MAG: hypothetical protein A2641_03290 [Candidatus Nomurabacteria bacterium RIFCSPHIGHO2_01_FULL_37_25]OGI75514.1 MAG: hypothetical protein A3D36_02935 [Candidatus Nomurabacteria bacterium RIFCSPHIGHO2_02_FULL_36_29]OGI87352.1 MAG: hypothetical protein A3A91_02555 [Candidatus Nomurabacteria bacterium RIFCSPLOWO2_01_FULL_36_16]OGI94900.1 MAG: hypothetical protein A3I84_00615 [Candidatus Nomurabacteria bacterium RIFCSPLOWO2_02_FULL_36_8]